MQLIVETAKGDEPRAAFGASEEYLPIHRVWNDSFGSTTQCHFREGGQWGRVMYLATLCCLSSVGFLFRGSMISVRDFAGRIQSSRHGGAGRIRYIYQDIWN